jgi:hypothetical protein
MRTEPPPIAHWILEHLTSGVRDEALAGDLIEALHNGRSNGWYWRQAIAACAVSWSESLRARTALLAFVLLWSMAAPAWNTVCLMVESDSVQNRFCSIFGPIWIVPALVAWTILHSIFLWGGLLIFGTFHRTVGGSLHPNRFKQAFFLAPLIFVPIYGLLFLTVDLHWYSYFEYLQLPASPLGQIADVRMLADVIRIPYFIAMLLALWRVVPRSIRVSTPVLSDLSEVNTATDSDVPAPRSSLSSYAAKRFFALMVGAGLMNSVIAGFLLCRLPESHSPSVSSLCIRAMLYVLAGVLTGVGGTYLYWKNPASPFSTREPVPFPLFALLCAGGWVWVPAIVILSEQLSLATSFVAMIGAFVLTSGLRRVSSSVQITIPLLAAMPPQGGASLFVESLYPAPLEIYGYVVAIGLYAGATALFVRSNFIATIFLVLAACVFAWKKTLPQDQGFDRSRESKRAVLRLVWITIPAVLVTAWALLDGVAHRNVVEAGTGENLHSADSLKKNSGKQSNGQTTPMGVDGYESVILWPYPDKRRVMPPITAREVLLAPGSKEPLVIRFNGPYWYFQAPNKFPGAAPHKAQGTPIGFDIQSNNSVPLVMDAHQYLGAAIPLALCREITVEIANRDNTAGAVSIGVLLMDGASAKQATLYLGEQPIASTQPEHFAIKPSPVFETLHFPIPRAAKIHKFSEITVLVLPDIEHAFNAPKIAVQQFQLYPR